MKGSQATSEEIREAKKAFSEYVNREENLIKKSKLLGFIPYVEKAYDMIEVQWYLKRAIADADAKHAFHEYQDMLTVVKAEKVNKWKRILPFLWALLIAVSIWVVCKGFETRYIYYTPAGVEISSETYSGPKMVIKEEAITIKFSHSTQSFVGHPAIRSFGILIGIISMGIFTAIKLEFI